ncbi:hypothetical protein OIU84_018803, partial [Salix udensis]
MVVWLGFFFVGLIAAKRLQTQTGGKRGRGKEA